MQKKFLKENVYLYILFAYLFSIAIRYIWVYQFGALDSFHWNNQLMINTNDGYIWASGVQNMIDNTFSNNHRIPGSEYGLVYFTYIVSKVLPFSLDTIILYMPSVISSLIVIPIVLLGKLYNKTLLGFFAALIASIAWSFYNRTMVGYYDSDLFALVFPAFITYFLIRTVKQESLVSLFVATLLILLYFYAYDASKPVIYGMGIGFILYCLIFLRDKEDFYAYLTLISVAMLDIDWQLRLILVVLSFLSFHKHLIKEKHIEISIAFGTIILFFYFGNVFDIIWYKVFEYVEVGIDKQSTLKFFQVHQTIREAGKIPFETFANRISGSIITFFIATIGYLLLVIRKKEFLLFLPLIGIGFFAYIGGLRFTVYAVPALAIGGVYFFYFLAKQFIEEKKYQYLAIVLGTIFFLYPNIQHVISYKVPTVLNKQEVEDLTKLKNIASTKDYTLSWWDYGYPIWYYSETNTLIDGGKHNHDNFIISEILLTTSQQEAARLSRLAIETYVDSNYSIVADTLFKNGKREQLNVRDYLEELKYSDIKLPKKTRDIYLYLPFRMMNIFPTIALFSNLNLKTGKPIRNVIFYPSSLLGEQNGKLVMRNGIVFDTLKGIVRIGSKTLKVKNFDIVTLDKDAVPQVDSRLSHLDGQVSIVYLKNYGKMIVMDIKTYNSVFVQMFMLGKYDKNLFELVISSPYSKIFKVKI